MTYSVLSLFSGGGGLDLGFEQAGFVIRACVDSDPESCETLRWNRPSLDVYELDIGSFEIPPEVDVVIGGPPCQGFSTAGKGDPNDPRNFLWQEYLRVVKAVAPRAVLLENVAGMANAKNRHHLDDVMSSLEGLGYSTEARVLNAADFGVPQVRRRLILMGVQGSVPTFPRGDSTHRRTVRDAIEDLRAAPPNPSINHVPNRHAPHVVERWKKLGYGETDPRYRRARLDPNKPSHTIRAGGGYGPRGDHLAGFHPPIHYSLPRQLTVRESARLQSFPDSWIFRGSKTAQGRQVGNAVPPLLALALAGEMLRTLAALDASTTVSDSVGRASRESVLTSQ